jgi:hypothetical protein
MSLIRNNEISKDMILNGYLYTTNGENIWKIQQTKKLYIFCKLDKHLNIDERIKTRRKKFNFISFNAKNIFKNYNEVLIYYKNLNFIETYYHKNLNQIIEDDETENINRYI